MFLEKNHNPHPPPPLKLNGRSLIEFNTKDEKIVKFDDEKIEKSEKTKHLGMLEMEQILWI
jgi:hypothetical protein